MNNLSKIVRNDLCPCGSSKKYNNCCGFADSLIHYTQKNDLHIFRYQLLKRAFEDSM
jgi:hypothetical protein